jgi:hypothetical protein
MVEIFMTYFLKYRRLFSWSVTTFCALIILENVIRSVLFPGWVVKNGSLHLASEIILAVSIGWLVIWMISIFKIPSSLKWLVSIVVMLVLAVSSCLTVYPIDTKTEPYDKTVLSRFTKGQKLIVREYQNAKTNGKIEDTVLVQDVFVFRKIFKRDD